MSLRSRQWLAESGLFSGLSFHSIFLSQLPPLRFNPSGLELGLTA